MQIIFPPSKQIKYLAMTSKNASASPFKGFQGSLCVNINLKRKISMFLWQHLWILENQHWHHNQVKCGVSYFWVVGGGSIIRWWPKETLWLKSPKHLDTLLANIFGYFECLKYLLIMFMKNWNVSPPAHISFPVTFITTGGQQGGIECGLWDTQSLWKSMKIHSFQMLE